ncbi:MAG: hypothetical protein EHM41_24070 [Chloroflexi bacterium]|nr:MAG: hypothetical protein EHM41_24070 [Chloroflexota bacterium]
MPYELFHERFNEIAMKETRTITIHNNPELPDDDYGFFEAYCNDENCDCRRVFFNVISRKRGEIVAVIAYGWEDSAFYAHWYRQNDPSIIRELQGPILNPSSKQSELAPALLSLVRNTLLKDPAYIDRLKRHYWTFKETIDPKHFKVSVKPRQQSQPANKKRKRHRPRS